MALTEVQRRLCRLIAANRVDSGESYVAGAVALNQSIGSDRISRDIDLFHDTREAVTASWEADRELLQSNGFEVTPIRVLPGFIEARARDADQSVLMQWTHDSAYRFFPLVEHEDLGLTLHPLDLATNKVLAMVGRLEVRDWIDVIECDTRLQPLGYLAWAAPGKDPGFSPAAILEHAGRTARYTQDEVDELAFAGQAPTAATLSQKWHERLGEARIVVDSLPPEEAGKCVLMRDGGLCRLDSRQLESALDRGELLFHTGAIRGALPRIVGA